MNLNNDLPPPISNSQAQAIRSGRRSLPPLEGHGFQHVLPSYPSSTMDYYYPPSHNVANYVHIPPISHSFTPFPPAEGAFGPLPSASQSHIPSLRRTPSVSFSDNIENHHNSPAYNQRTNDNSQNSHSIHSLSPIAFAPQQPVSVFAQPQPTRWHPVPPFRQQPPLPPPQPIPPLLTPTVHNHSSFFNSSLPSTKDVPILSGKHDWGPWHSAVRTLIMNANLLGHIADDPLPGAYYDPGLWPTYPPAVHRHSTQAEIQLFTEWWTRDGLASHILTSRLSSSVLGCLPIANERMGHRRSSRTVYLTLRHQFGAGDYSAVMVIEARLRQLKCLPMLGDAPRST
jgi:hypothetical protein